MPRKAEVVVFLGSPGELNAERQIVRDVVADLNSHLATFGVRIDLREGGDRAPAGGRPQSAINPDVDVCEIFVALFWRTLGSPSGQAASGTLEEYERVCERRKEAAARWPLPLIWSKKVHEDLLQDPGEKYLGVDAFHRSLINSRADFFADFEDLKAFEQAVRRRLWDEVVARAGLVAVPESLQGARGAGPSARPPVPRQPDRRDDTPESQDLSGLVVEGPAGLLPDGPERYQAAITLAETDPAAAAELLSNVVDEVA